jgi:hypothetical protein
LYQSEQVDPLFWMTNDFEVETRARALEDSTQRELFCRNFGGHWCEERNRFFRYPMPAASLPEDSIVLEGSGYDTIPIGRARFLLKLEEAAALHFQKESIKASNTQELASTAFMNRINRIIADWIEDLECAMVGVLMDESTVAKYVQRVDAAMRALSRDEEELSPVRDRKRRREEGDDFSPQTRRQMQRIDDEAVNEVEVGPRRSSRNRLFGHAARVAEDVIEVALEESSETLDEA